MKELIGIVAIIWGVLGASIVIIKGGKVSELMAWCGWIVLGVVLLQ